MFADVLFEERSDSEIYKDERRINLKTKRQQRRNIRLRIKRDDVTPGENPASPVVTSQQGRTISSNRGV